MMLFASTIRTVLDVLADKEVHCSRPWSALDLHSERRQSFLRCGRRTHVHRNDVMGTIVSTYLNIFHQVSTRWNTEQLLRLHLTSTGGPCELSPWHYQVPSD